jgi:hypothetical protein
MADKFLDLAVNIGLEHIDTYDGFQPDSIMFTFQSPANERDRLIRALGVRCDQVRPSPFRIRYVG